MGFGEKWDGKIKWCHSAVTYSGLNNGSPNGFFHSFKELRQRDFFPHLFVIGKGAFSILI